LRWCLVEQICQEVKYKTLWAILGIGYYAI